MFRPTARGRTFEKATEVSRAVRAKIWCIVNVSWRVSKLYAEG